MEPLFENRCIRNEAIFLEFYRRFRLLSPPYICSYLICAYCLYHFFVYWATYDIFALSYLFGPALLPCAIWYACRRDAKLALRREIEINGGTPAENHIVVTEYGIASHYPNSSTEISFSNIKKVRRSRNLIYVITKAKITWIIPKNTFTRGTADEFLSFLKSKGIKVR